MVDPRQAILLRQKGSARCELGAVGVVISPQALFEKAHGIFCLPMQRVALGHSAALKIQVTRHVALQPIHFGWEHARRYLLQRGGVKIARGRKAARLLIVDDGRLHG